MKPELVESIPDEIPYSSSTGTLRAEALGTKRSTVRNRVGWGGADGTYRTISNQHASTLGEEGPRSVGGLPGFLERVVSKDILGKPNMESIPNSPGLAASLLLEPSKHWTKLLSKHLPCSITMIC